MMTISSYIRRGQHNLKALALDPRVHTTVKMTGQVLSGLVLSAAGLGGAPQTIALGLICASNALQALLVSAGSVVGYWLFWGSAGLQGQLWTVLGLLCAATLGDRRISREVPLLLPSLAGLIVSGSGVLFQIWLADNTSIPIYLLRVALGASTAWLFAVVRQRRDPVADWLACALVVLGLARFRLTVYLNLGVVAAGALAAVGAFPAAALAGLALDLSGTVAAPMTAVLCLAYFTRMIPRQPGWMCYLMPASMYIIGAWLCGVHDLRPLPALMLGGGLGHFLPQQGKLSHRRGETGVAQVRLEITAGVFSQMEQLLLEVREPPIDEGVLIQRAAERACGTCANRKNCRDREMVAQMQPILLHRPLFTDRDFPLSCRKTGRVVNEVRRAQEQLRNLRSSREQIRECRGAVVQQYRFMADYLMELSDNVAQRLNEPAPRYSVEVAVYANRVEADNGDRCIWFMGTGCKYYVLMCDGMGTGLGAVDEGKTAAALLKKLLCAGFPAKYALRTLNSLCVLRGRSGAVTADLAEISLDSGKATLYKWGAAPSYLLHRGSAEKIGTAGPPPGLSLTDQRETVTQLSLRRGEWLVMLSDGVEGEDSVRGWAEVPAASPGELAAELLARTDGERGDDATAAVVRLRANLLSA